MKNRMELMEEVCKALEKLHVSPRGLDDHVRLRPMNDLIDLIETERELAWNRACEAIAQACDKDGQESFEGSERIPSGHDLKKWLQEQAVGAWRCKLHAEALLDKCK
jgi:hypothetical protein